jgi:hypothetical protein
MVQRQQSWHLPDPVDATPVERGITVYYTSLLWGGIDFAVLEDRKFKSAPLGNIPEQGPRPDHITNEKYDPATVDLPGLQLLGSRQEAFLAQWGHDWTGAELKVVLSQTAFCGAVHMHGGPNARLLADLDCNGWPQKGRNRALTLLRQAQATHLCGDQHLAVVVKHGIHAFGDGPYAFTSPALVNTIYGRWWHPADEQPGANPVPNSPLEWTGDFHDGLGNKISMLAYVNPKNVNNERERADGYGLVRFDKAQRQVTFECWPRFCEIASGTAKQFPGWPVKIDVAANDGRPAVAWLPEIVASGVERPVLQVTDDQSGEVLYTIRLAGPRFRPPVFAAGKYTVRLGANRPDGPSFPGLTAQPEPQGELPVTISP